MSGSGGVASGPMERTLLAHIYSRGTAVRWRRPRQGSGHGLQGNARRRRPLMEPIKSSDASGRLSSACGTHHGSLDDQPWRAGTAGPACVNRGTLWWPNRGSSGLIESRSFCPPHTRGADACWPLCTARTPPQLLSQVPPLPCHPAAALRLWHRRDLLRTPLT